MSERGTCDKKQYEHAGQHEQVFEMGQSMPPFPCVNWRPGHTSAPPDPNYQNAYTHAVQEYNKHQPAPPAPAAPEGAEQEAFNWLKIQPGPIGVIHVPMLLARYAASRVQVLEERLVKAEEALRNLIIESEYSRTGKLPSVAQLNKSQKWWLTNATEPHSWDPPEKRAALTEDSNGG